MSEKVQQTETGNALQRFLKRKNIIFSAKRYGIDALGAMAQGLFASLLIGTIIGTLGEQIGSQVLVDAGGFAKSVAGPAMAISIGYALQAPQLVLFSLLAVGAAANSLGGAGGPLAVLIVAIVAAECGKAVSKETKIDILVTPLVTILSGVLLSMWCAPTIGAAASAVGSLIMWATERKDGVVEATHGGLECGLLMEKIPGLDAVSMGPELHDVHSVRERLSVPSTERTYELVCELLRRSC